MVEDHPEVEVQSVLPETVLCRAAGSVGRPLDLWMMVANVRHLWWLLWLCCVRETGPVLWQRALRQASSGWSGRRRSVVVLLVDRGCHQRGESCRLSGESGEAALCLQMFQARRLGRVNIADCRVYRGVCVCIRVCVVLGIISRVDEATCRLGSTLLCSGEAGSQGGVAARAAVVPQQRACWAR